MDSRLETGRDSCSPGRRVGKGGASLRSKMGEVVLPPPSPRASTSLFMEGLRTSSQPISPAARLRLNPGADQAIVLLIVLRGISPPGVSPDFQLRLAPNPRKTEHGELLQIGAPGAKKYAILGYSGKMRNRLIKGRSGTRASVRNGRRWYFLHRNCCAPSSRPS